ncbi:MAG: hypothetical protein DRN33_04675, partial [Thermoplasmata archaeon]
MIRLVDGGAAQAQGQRRLLGDELYPPIPIRGKVEDADEHRPECGDEMDVRAILVLLRDAGGYLRA